MGEISTIELHSEADAPEESRLATVPALSPVSCQAQQQLQRQLAPPQAGGGHPAAVLRFHLNGTVAPPPARAEGVGAAAGSSEPQQEGGSTAGDVCEVALRDILRTDGDPDALGYTLADATTLARSAVSQQRAAALGLVANVLRRAHLGLASAQLAAPGVPWAEARWRQLLRFHSAFILRR